MVPYSNNITSIKTMVIKTLLIFRYCHIVRIKLDSTSQFSVAYISISISIYIYLYLSISIYIYLYLSIYLSIHLYLLLPPLFLLATTKKSSKKAFTKTKFREGETDTVFNNPCLFTSNALIRFE